ncbi:arginyl-tRNA synthetase [Lasiosphaeria miniovina]|uniref:arginine--tRNA ligase n=1 Tax=Lasiosphaeria miniovina TaxID=1954250 RepID=A0AA40DK29_9PEZI|nr:arginyl-tRNA synthetase [Lasiosphaeria miniovina]KAK0703702.1 arginyl-tRNA synthetase [Lasiosphaeria miniovina]
MAVETPQVSVAGASPSTNPLDAFRIAIARELARITNLNVGFIFAALDRSSTFDKGDLVLAVPRLRIKSADLTPTAQAENLASQFRVENCPLVKQPIADGISLQFYMNPAALPGILLPFVLQHGNDYGSDRAIGLRKPAASSADNSTGNIDEDDANRKTVIVEFSSPNIAKEFHFGHLRSTIIGAFLANLYEICGHRVIRMNYLGDWGRQFGLLASGWEKYGDEAAFDRDPIRHLFEIYVKISADFKPEDVAYKEAKARGEDTSVHETQGLLGASKAYFKRMEDGDPDALALWERFRALSIQRYEATYARLNIRFTDYSGESKVRKETIARVLQVLEDRGIAEPDGGALIVDFAKHGKKKVATAILRNRNGTSNYLLRDLGAAVQRHDDYTFDEMVYVVMSEQEAHLKWLFLTMELMGEPYTALSKKMKHISFGKVRGMSTRRGTVVFLDDVVNDVTDFMHEQMRGNATKYSEVADPAQTAEALAVSAIMVQDMLGKRANNYSFDLQRMTSFEGDTGPYLQYAHARLCSISRKAGFTRDDLLATPSDFNLLLADSSYACDLLRVVARYPDMVRQAMKTLEPTTILTYLFALAHTLSSSYDHLRVVNPPEGPSMSRARAALYGSARQTLHNGMVLLGLTPVDRM